MNIVKSCKVKKEYEDFQQFTSSPNLTMPQPMPGFGGRREVEGMGFNYGMRGRIVGGMGDSPSPFNSPTPLEVSKTGMEEKDEGYCDEDDEMGSLSEYIEVKSDHWYTCKAHPNVSCVSQDELIRHIKKHTYKFQCHLCEKSYTSKYNLESHVSTIHDGKTYPCTVEGCGKVLASKNGLSKHVSSMHTCEVCRKIFSKPEDKKAHLDKCVVK